MAGCGHRLRPHLQGQRPRFLRHDAIPQGDLQRRGPSRNTVAQGRPASAAACAVQQPARHDDAADFGEAVLGEPGHARAQAAGHVHVASPGDTVSASGDARCRGRVCVDPGVGVRVVAVQQVGPGGLGRVALRAGRGRASRREWPRHEPEQERVAAITAVAALTVADLGRPLQQRRPAHDLAVPSCHDRRWPRVLDHFRRSTALRRGGRLGLRRRAPVRTQPNSGALRRHRGRHVCRHVAGG
mmetsp:Transcript_12299/g.35369  ORF Transcript_12299/g.35369 Transcript_12299/m.35369 type:complete len:242 (-) Transcript_12299:268-993(-)